MTTQPQSHTDYKRIFNETRDALRLSSDAYDQGFKGEAKRLAGIARVLLHDTPKSKSLFAQLNVKTAGKYFATPSPYSAGNVMTESRLIQQVSGGGRDIYRPILDDFPPVFAWGQLDFGQWWSEPVIRDKQQRLLSRGHIVLACKQRRRHAPRSQPRHSLRRLVSKQFPGVDHHGRCR
jgi:hypothetical protein